MHYRSDLPSERPLHHQGLSTAALLAPGGGLGRPRPLDVLGRLAALLALGRLEHRLVLPRLLQPVLHLRMRKTPVV